MSDIWSILWPALFASGVAIGVTLVIERLGGRLGGLIGTLPTTIVPASIGIYSQCEDAAVFADAMGAVPAGMLVDVGFLFIWGALPGRLPAIGIGARLGLMVIISLLGWFVGAYAFVMGLMGLKAVAVDPLAAGTLLMGVSIIAGLLACLRAPPAPAGARSVGPLTLVLRGLFAGAAIAFAVWLARLGPTAAGMASVFPAIFMTTMVSLWISQGEAVQAGAVGPMMLGSASVSAFALLAAVLMPLPALGPALGAAAAWFLSVLAVTVPAWMWLRRREDS